MMLILQLEQFSRVFNALLLAAQRSNMLQKEKARKNLSCMDFLQTQFRQGQERDFLLKILLITEKFGWQRYRVQSGEAIESQHVLCKDGEREEN